MKAIASRRTTVAILVLLVCISTSSLSVALAEEESNVGVLRVANLAHPRQVAPSARASFVVDVEYAIKENFNATVKSSLFEGYPANLGAQLWQSDPVVVSGGGDQLWTANLTAPSAEGEWKLTVFAYYLEGGEWKYYTDPDQGPGLAQTTLKVSPLATLEIDLGLPDVPVKIDGSTAKTSSLGNVMEQLPVGVVYQVSVQAILSRDDSTRFLFAGWQDGLNQTQRILMLDGDVKISGSYKSQYLLKVSSVLSSYSSSAWYDSSSNVTLRVDSSVPMSGVFGMLGLRYVFKGWSGDIESSVVTVNVIMDKPKVINANFDVDYTPIVIPAILLTGIIVGVVLGVLLRRRRTPVEEKVEGEIGSSRVCSNCGEPTEESWTHCVHCGKDLGPSESVQS